MRELRRRKLPTTGPPPNSWFCVRDLSPEFVVYLGKPFFWKLNAKEMFSFQASKVSFQVLGKLTWKLNISCFDG